MPRPALQAHTRAAAPTTALPAQYAEGAPHPPAWRGGRLRRACSAVLLAVLASAAVASELLDLPLEQLVETDVVSAAQFAHELTDAPSAVSVVTAEDIRIFGYRNLAEILDSMRGVHVSSDGYYGFLDGRGFGGPTEYAGRIGLLIDGYPAADNIFNQLYLGDEGLLDVGVIERVEYAPGPGAAIYGNNAFLGVINVITRRGRDLDGGRIALSGGSHDDAKARATWGKRFDGGSELLLSASAHRADHSKPVSATHDAQARDERVFLKGQHGNWRLEGAAARRIRLDHDVDGGEARQRTADENAFWFVEHNGQYASLRSSVRFYYGQYRYLDKLSWIPDADSEDASFWDNARLVGRWWGVDAKLSTVTASGHRIVAGAEFRDDFERRLDSETRYEDPEFDAATSDHLGARTHSLYLQDEFSVHRDLDLNLGLRYDRRSDRLAKDAFNPRVALLFRARPDTSVRLSHGVATRFSSWSDEWYYGGLQSERVATTELVVDHQRPGLRLLATAYHYRSKNEAFDDSNPAARSRTRGVELEAQWQWRSVSIRGSHAWQDARDGNGDWRSYAPHHLSKLQVSAPLAGEALRASLAARYVGRRLTTWERRKTGGYAVADLTLTSRTLLPGVELTASVRNLFDHPYSDPLAWPDPDGIGERNRRTWWMQLEYAFK